MFDEICSIYESATDAYGRFVDYDTGECIQQMSIREFCLMDRWKPYVQRLRAMRQEYGSKAKKMPEYIATKKKLPGATLSGLFSLYEDDSLTHPGQRVMVSRRETHLQQHTGWLAIDIDLDDNQQISNFDNVRNLAQFRPEIALLMRSCSGTGYFGLIRLAYPERHKEQFKALLKEYAAFGIMLDKQCGNIGRVRFASWDDKEHIYINENAVAYKGMEVSEVELSPISHYQRTFSDVSRHAPCGGTRYGERSWEHDTPDIVYLKAQRLVSKIEAKGVDIMQNYDAWVKCGISLYSIDHVAGMDMWRRISRFRPSDSNAHRESEIRRMWPQFSHYPKVTENTFIKLCHQSNIFLTRDELREIYGRAK